MAAICRQAPGRHLANMLAGGCTPLLPPERLAALGFALAAYPLVLLSAAITAMRASLAELAAGRHPEHEAIPFADLRTFLGFDAYDREAQRYGQTGRVVATRSAMTAQPRRGPRPSLRQAMR